MKRNTVARTLIICVLMMGMLSSCGTPSDLPEVNDVGYGDEVFVEEVIIEEEAVALAAAPAAM